MKDGKDGSIEGVLNLGSNDPDAGLSSFKMAQVKTKGNCYKLSAINLNLSRLC